MGKGESTSRAKGGSNLVVGGNGAKVAGVEVVQLPNKEVNVVRGEGVVLLQIIEGNKREGSRKIPPKDMNGRARVLGRVNDVYYGRLKEKAGEMWICTIIKG